MIESNVVAASPGRMFERRRSAPQPHSERARSFATLARATFEVIGFLSVLLVFALALSPSLRATAIQAGSDIGMHFADDGDDAADEDAAVGPPDGPKIGQAVSLEPANNNVVTYLARRYHVADGAVRLMVSAAQSAGKERQLDPLLILAVVAVESSMNPFAQSPVGATGLMQVMPSLHGGKFSEQDGSRGALDPVANIHVGSQILAELVRRGGSVERGLQLYVGAGNASDDGGYANRVLAELARLRVAASGGVGAALAMAMRSDVHATTDGGGPISSSLPAETPAALQKPGPA